MSSSPTILFVPGLRDHVEIHWQTILARQIPGAVTVAPLEHDKLSCAARVAALDDAYRQIHGPVLLVAHSAGVMIAVHWAARCARPVHGALFATPADLESPLPKGYPDPDAITKNGWLPIPRKNLPFPTIVAASTDDPLARFLRVVEYAGDWGARLINIGPVGHLNPASGFGEWKQAASLLKDLVR